jgi:hypothetical protein
VTRTALAGDIQEVTGLNGGHRLRSDADKDPARRIVDEEECVGSVVVENDGSAELNGIPPHGLFYRQRVNLVCSGERGKVWIGGPH